MPCNVWVVQRGEQLSFTLEPRNALGIVRHRVGQGFDRDVAAEHRVMRAIDLAHASSADGGDHFVGAETGADSQGQTAADYTGEAAGHAMTLQNAAV